MPPTACYYSDPLGTLICSWKNLSTGCSETLNTGFPVPPFQDCTVATSGAYANFPEAEYSTFNGCGSGCQIWVYDKQCNLTFQMTAGGPGTCHAVSSTTNFTSTMVTRMYIACGQCGPC